MSYFEIIFFPEELKPNHFKCALLIYSVFSSMSTSLLEYLHVHYNHRYQIQPRLQRWHLNSKHKEMRIIRNGSFSVIKQIYFSLWFVYFTY